MQSNSIIKLFNNVTKKFTPNWFTVTMGTGIVALNLHASGLGGEVINVFAKNLWLFNIGLFFVFSILMLGRFVFFSDSLSILLEHPIQSMFFGAIPMGLATIINGFLAFGIGFLGDQAISIAFHLWLVDVVMSLLCAIIFPYLMITRQQHCITSMTSVWLLPIVACEVAAASGGTLAPHLDDSLALIVIFLSYAIWAISVPLALSVLVIYLQRLILHKLPGQELGTTIWLPLGPIGTGALALILLGDALHGLNSSVTMNYPMLADFSNIADAFGLICATLLWGLGIWWLVIAMIATLSYAMNSLSFTMGWWAFTFPLGVYTLATLTLYHATNLAMFAVVSKGLLALLFLFWIMVSYFTLTFIVKSVYQAFSFKRCNT